MRLFIITIFICFFSAHTNAQVKATTGWLSIHFGAGHLSRQDQILSPFVMQDFSPINIDFQYRKEKKVLQEISLKSGMYNPILGEPFTFYWPGSAEPQRTYPHNFILVQANYGWAKKIKESGTHKMYFGGALLNNVNATPYNYGPFGTFGYFASFSIGPWLEFVNNLSDKQSFNAGIRVPLLAWVARSPYLANDDEYMWNTYSHSGVKTFFAYVADGKLQTLNRFQNISLSAEYRYKLGNRWHIGAGYRFDFLHHSKPLHLYSYNHVISLLTGINF